MKDTDFGKQPEAKTQSRAWLAPFFSVWTGAALSLVGSRIAQFALVWWLTQKTGSATVLATASLVALIPEIALGPIAGAYVDRWDRRKVMIFSDGFVALVSLWLGYLFWIESLAIWHVYAAMFLRAVAGSFHWPALSASTSLMVPKEHLSRVAGANQTLYGMLNIIGPPLGALFMAIMPLFGVMLLDVGTATLAILPLMFVRVPRPERQTDDTAGQVSIWTDIQEGFHYMRAWPGLMALIGMAMVLKIALTPAFSLLPLLVSQHFQGDAAQLSLLEAIFGGGVVAGGVLLSAWGGFKRKILTTMVGLFVLAVGFLFLGIVPANAFWMALVAALGIGLAIPLIDGPIMAIMQGNVAPEMQGRVFTLMGSLIWLTSPFSLAVAGPVSDWLGLQVWYLIAGFLCLATGLAGLFIPALLNIEENGNGKVEAAEPLVEASVEA